MQAQVRLDHQLLAVEGEHDVHAMLELSLPEADGAIEQPPLRLALVLDRSGSMAGERLDAAKRALESLVSRLDPADAFGLVAFDDDIQIAVPAAPLSDKPGVLAAIRAILPLSLIHISEPTRPY